MPQSNIGSRFWLPSLLFSLALVLAGCSSPDDPPKKSPPPAPPQTNTFTLGGTISGSTGQLTLNLHNSEESLTHTGDGTFEFQTQLEENTQYSLSIVTPPSGQQCLFDNDSKQKSGTLGAENVTDLNVTCSDVVVTPDPVSISGSVVDLSGSLTVSIGETSQTVTAPSDLDFTFSELAANTSHTLKISNAPTTQLCSFDNNNENERIVDVTTVDVTGIQITCVDRTFSISGGVVNLSGTLKLALTDNAGNELRNAEIKSTRPSQGFTFQGITANTSYILKITEQPTAQQCLFDNNSEEKPGTLGAESVTGIQISCTDLTVSISGSVSGLTGLMDVNIKDSNNTPHGSEEVNSDNPNTDFTFDELPVNANYTLSIASNPGTQHCEFDTSKTDTQTVSVETENVSGIAVTCSDIPTYTVTANISGWVGTDTGQLKLSDGSAQGQTLDVSGNDAFTFQTPLLRGTPYTLTIGSPLPESMTTCALSNNSTNTTTGIQANVTVTIACSEKPKLSIDIQGLVSPTIITAKVNDKTIKYTADNTLKLSYMETDTSYTVTLFSGLRDTADTATTLPQTCKVGEDTIPSESSEGLQLQFDAGVSTATDRVIEVRCVFDFSPAELTMTPWGIKNLVFRWSSDARFTYRLSELINDPDPNSGDWTPIHPHTLAGTGAEMIYRHEVPLYALAHRDYVLQTCYTDTNEKNHCQYSAILTTRGAEDQDQYNYLLGSIGYFKGGDTTNAGNLFGRSVSLSDDGTVMAVGAFGYDVGSDPNDNTGGVFIFRKTDGVWAQEGSVLVPNIAEAQDHVGMAVSLSGNGEYLAVGTPDEDGSGSWVNPTVTNGTTKSGAVYVFHHNTDNNTWTRQAYLKATSPETSSFFGLSLSFDEDGSTLAVGARLQGNDDRGAVYIYYRQNDSWLTSGTQLLPTGMSDGARFGMSVSLSNAGQTLAIGAPHDFSNAPATSGRGSVYVYFRNNKSTHDWGTPKVIKSSEVSQDATGFFGSSVSVSGNGAVIAVGDSLSSRPGTGVNPVDSGNNLPNSGSAYVFRWTQEQGWVQQAHIKAENADANDNFGRTISLSNDGMRLAVGTGADYAYDEPPSTTTKSGEDSNAIGLNGNRNDNSLSDPGAVYTYVLSNSDGWVFESYIKASNTAFEQAFGEALSLSGDGNTLAVGAFGEDSSGYGIAWNIGTGAGDSNTNAPQAGAVYLY
ncbi:hypothetical protein [Saccharospirillum mangrovi]|uniref:hypothetical protein n=1 Tax=Saccharospirillum mangrovi TaxID=2161747 RepID=UPI0013B447D0|nr:hypothetical protein [Saccharospirillum mangrovi]